VFCLTSFQLSDEIVTYMLIRTVNMGSDPRQATFNVCEYGTILKFDFGRIVSAGVNRAVVYWP
jgi:hypothetical protein